MPRRWFVFVQIFYFYCFARFLELSSPKCCVGNWQPSHHDHDSRSRSRFTIIFLLSNGSIKVRSSQVALQTVLYIRSAISPSILRMPLSGMQQLNQLIDELETVISNTKSSSSISRPAAIICSTDATSECKQKGADKHQTLGVAAKKEKNVAEIRVKEATPSDEININSLDLRVGIIRSVVRHEGSEKLYCEDIDVGEDELRPIASGLVPFYSLEEMQGRRVIVVANLLPRKLVGFKSNGMVLCASKVDSDGKEVVEFVDPPASAVPGERIIGSGLSSLPLSAKQCDKRKAFETLASNLMVDSNGVAIWNGLPLVTQSTGEQCSVPKLRDCFIH